MLCQDQEEVHTEVEVTVEEVALEDHVGECRMVEDLMEVCITEAECMEEDHAVVCIEEVVIIVQCFMAVVVALVVYLAWF